MNTRIFASWTERASARSELPPSALSLVAESTCRSLPQLHKFNDKSVPKSELAELERLDVLAEGLVASDPARRQEARRQVASVGSIWLSAVVERCGSRSYCGNGGEPRPASPWSSTRDKPEDLSRQDAKVAKRPEDEIQMS